MSTATRFKCLEKLGEGAYGVVYRAREIATDQIVALKRVTISNEEEGVPATAIREVCLLKELRHVNIVRLYDVLFDPRKMTLIFELCECDLKRYMDLHRRRNLLDVECEVKPILKQIFIGLHFLHSHSVVHRDLKPENIFLNLKKSPPAAVGPSTTGEHSGGRVAIAPEAAGGALPDGFVVKIGDFGLARVENIPVKKYTHDVVSLWYRSPDVILGSALYGFAVDMWSIGCILAEMVTGKPLINGRTETEQMLRILQLLGTPTKESWPSLTTYPKHRQVFEAVAQQVREQQLQQQQQQQMQEQRYGRSNVNSNVNDDAARGVLDLQAALQFASSFDHYVETTQFRKRAGDKGVDLLRALLRYEPSQRITAQDALKHPFLQNVAAPLQRPIDETTALLTQALQRNGLWAQ